MTSLSNPSNNILTAAMNNSTTTYHQQGHVSAEQALLSMISNPNSSLSFSNPNSNNSFLLSNNFNPQQQQILNSSANSQQIMNPQQEYMKHILMRIDQSLDMVSQNLFRDLDSFYMMQHQEFNHKKRKFSEYEEATDYNNGAELIEEGAEGVGCNNSSNFVQKSAVQQELDNESIELQQLTDWIQNKKRKKNTSQGKKEILKEFLMLNKNNPYPSERQKEIFMKELDYDKKQLNNWFINARKRYLRKKVAYTPPDIRNKNEFDSILENKVRQSMNHNGEEDDEQNLPLLN